jgi:hypothetical protein
MPKTSSLELLKKICDPLGGRGDSPECFSWDEFSHPSETAKKKEKKIVF